MDGSIPGPSGVPKRFRAGTHSSKKCPVRTHQILRDKNLSISHQLKASILVLFAMVVVNHYLECSIRSTFIGMGSFWCLVFAFGRGGRAKEEEWMLQWGYPSIPPLSSSSALWPSSFSNPGCGWNITRLDTLPLPPKDLGLVLAPQMHTGVPLLMLGLQIIYAVSLAAQGLGW